jgi:hypothetical protein
MYAKCSKQAHNAECHFAKCRYIECHFAKCRYTECRYADCSDIIESVTMPSGIILSAVMLSVLSLF